MHNYLYIKSLGQGTQFNINADIVKNLSIAIPSIERQREIVEVLDNFHNLLKSITLSFPAEIQARRKQYEYYREKLLTFKELKIA